jgi:hypothetical protein
VGRSDTLMLKLKGARTDINNNLFSFQENAGTLDSHLFVGDVAGINFVLLGDKMKMLV